jgi:hypothetical protein
MARPLFHQLRRPAPLLAAAAIAVAAATASPAAPSRPGPISTQASKPMSAPTTAAPATVRWTMRPGDTLYSLSRRWFPGAGAVEQVRRLNRIGDVHRVAPGKVITIPRALLADELSMARVESFSGEVTLQPAGAAFPARAGASLSEGAVIRTGRGFVSLRLADQSVVTLPSQTTVRIARLRRVLMTGAVERAFTAEAGRLRATVTPMTEPGSTFEVRTPLTVAAVRGTEFRVSFDAAGQTATTAVEEGRVAFAGAAAPGPAPATGAALPEQLIQPGFGALAGPTGPQAAIPLLPAPRLADPDAPQTGEALSFALQPLPGAAAYAVAVARDAGLLDLVSETRGPGPVFALPSLATGTWFVRISAIDPNGLEGLPRTYTFDRVRNGVAGGMDDSGAGFERRYQFKWSGAADGQPQYRFQLAPRGDPAHPVVDEPVGTTMQLAVTGLAPGEYAWRVLSLVPFKGAGGSKLIAAWSGEQHFEVTARR